MEKVIAYLNRLYRISPLLEAEILRNAKSTTIKNNEWLIREGEFCNYAWYLQRGLVRCYYSPNAHEATVWFLEENNFIALSWSLLHNRRSRYYVQAIENCQLLSFRIEAIQHMLQTFPEAQQVRHGIADEYSYLKDVRIRATGFHTPAGRYAYFTEHFSHILGRLKLEHIASYLDISRSSLARVRRRNT